MPFAFVVLPEGAGSVFASWCIFRCHLCGPFLAVCPVFSGAGSASVGVYFGVYLTAEIGVKRRKTCKNEHSLRRS